MSYEKKKRSRKEKKILKIDTCPEQPTEEIFAVMHNGEY